ncbi:MAG: hypothetical protein IJU61_03580 [Victivallales bacterium]|nr:hypothetical protein [Victivallales bacterium]
MNESTRVVKLLILAIVGLLFGAYCIMSLFSIETAENHAVVNHYGDVLKESAEVKAALAAQGVKEYIIFNGRRLGRHHIQFVTDRPVVDQDAIRKLCKEYLQAHVEKFEKTIFTFEENVGKYDRNKEIRQSTERIE